MNNFGVVMKFIVVCLSVLAVVVGESAKENHLKCKLESKPSENPLPKTNWIDIKDDCVNLASAQIRMEFEAALAYLQLGSYFSQHDVNRPGFAKFFFDASSEERQHGIKVFDYLLMRGQHPTPDLQTLLSTSTDKLKGLDGLLKSGKISGLEALNKALDFEVDVTRSIKAMIRACEDTENLSEKDRNLLLGDKESVAPNDYHMVDWLITDLLDEQLKGQRELAGRISTLYKMKKGYGEIADFLYDKTLLEDLGSKA